MLSYRQCFKERVKLGTVAHQAAGLVITADCAYIMATHEQVSCVRHLFASQALERGCLACACDAEKSETLTVLQSEAEIVDCFLLEIVTFC